MVFVKPAFKLWLSYGKVGPAAWTKPTFLIGDMWEAMRARKTIGQVLETLCRKNDKEPFFGVYKLLKPILVVKDPELVSEVLVKNFSSFGNNEVTFDGGADEVFRENPFSVGLDRWKELRTRLSQAFSPSRVKLAYDDLLTSSRCLADFVAAAGADTSQDGLLLCKRFTAHASARVLFGIESHSLEVGSEPGVFYDMGHEVFNGSMMQSLRFTAYFFFPPLLHIIGHQLVDWKVINFFRKLMKDSIEYRHKEGVVRDDFVSHAAKALIVDGKVDEAALKKMANQAINSYIETFETSALSVGSTLLLLATHPKEQEQLRAEIRERVKPGQDLDYETVTTLPFLDKVIKETMRLFPPADTIRRCCTKATRLQSASGRSVNVEPGTAVYIPVDALHHDPAIYSHPHDFWPDHFSAEEIASRPKNTFLGFSEGPRQCPGMKYATLKVKTAIATLLQRFEVTPGEQQVLPIKRDPKAFIINYEGGIWLKFRPLP
ncbi:Cytochrome P450 9e2 [Frankliniella fusca]|uniref:Cytochrome P450 9e2 n=1 Tax=Frankliniella fusca TaxID=407009 RepID=A0AAE1HZU8_9NEOP|nr:Cytochrome P450 9e2 [Frankliniella fusca]